jgi:hypothetical protein
MTEPAGKLILAPDVVVRVVDGEALLVKLHDETVFALNATGARIVQLLTDGRSVDGVAEVLGLEYDVAHEEAVREVCRLVDDLMERGLVTSLQGGSAE